MNFEEQRKRYLNDPEFKGVVNVIYYNFLKTGMFTVGEIKDAVVFAGIKFESEQVKPFIQKKG